MQNYHIYLIIALIICEFSQIESQITCIPPEQSVANITSWVTANNSLSLTVNNKTLNVSYCADVINWPISNNTLYNFQHYDSGSFFHTNKKFQDKIL